LISPMDILLVGTLSLLCVTSREWLAYCDVQRHLGLWEGFRDHRSREITSN